MTSHHLRRDNNHTVFTSKTPHFCKAIHEETIEDGILGIPSKFVSKYGHQLSSTVKLEVPSGAIWSVELTKTDGKVRLQKGWREFAEHYSLQIGSFVVFRYERNGHFHVMIFDTTDSEIEYPYTSTEDDDDHTSMELCADVSGSKKRKGKPDLPCPLLPAPKKVTTDSQYKREVGVTSARPSLKTQAIQRASAFKSTENPDFVVFMQPSYVTDRYRMGIPSHFARNFLRMHKCDLTLSNSAGKTWLVMYYSNAENKTPQAHIRGDGWRAFVKDNHLDVGDICVFELIKQHPEILMKVVVNPSTENASKAYRPKAHGSIDCRVKARSFVSDTELNCEQSPCSSTSKKTEDPTDSYIEILDGSPLDQKTKKKSTSPSVRPRKVMTANPSGSTETKEASTPNEKELQSPLSVL